MLSNSHLPPLKHRGLVPWVQSQENTGFDVSVYMWAHFVSVTLLPRRRLKKCMANWENLEDFLRSGCVFAQKKRRQFSQTSETVEVFFFTIPTPPF